MKTAIVGILIIMFALLPVQNASAHVLVTDETKTKGAILHIIPDDDPVAGEESTIYFDTQSQLSGAETVIKLSVKDSAGGEDVVETKAEGSLVTANYTFKTQGVYVLTFTITTNGTSYVFEQSQRVTRGVSSGALNKPTYAWAQILVLASGIGFALLIILVINRRKDIAEHSTF